jgi:hypothetical protein
MVMDTCVRWLKGGRGGAEMWVNTGERVISVTESEERERERDAGSTWRKGTDVREVETCRTGLSVVCSEVLVEFLSFLVFLRT